ncbi:MAG: GNAT family N-acetyltransferase [Bacteroidota bacterium]
MSESQTQRVAFASVVLNGAEVLANPALPVQDRWRRRLERVPTLRAQRYLAEQATLGDHVVAMALAAARPDTLAQVYSLATAPAHRQQGLATALLGRIEARLAEAGGQAVQALYRTDLRSLVAVETILAKRGWDPPRPAQYLFRGTAAVLDTPAFQGLMLPDGCTVFDWATLTDAEHVALAQALERTIPAQLSPFQQPDLLDAACSVGARFQGDVVGWMLLHQVGEAGVRQYTTLWVRRDFVRTPLALVLLRTAIERHARHSPDGRGLFAVEASNRTMVNLARRRLGLTPAVTLRIAGKRL